VAIATALKGLVSLWQMKGWQAFLGKIPKIGPKLLWVNWKPLVKAAFVGGIALLAAVCTGIAAGLGWPAIIIGGLSAGVVAALGAMGVNAVGDAATGGSTPPANP
jgi:hypothetical protein